MWDTTKPNGQPRRKLDTSRAEAAFGFRATVPLREGIGAHRRLVSQCTRSRVTSIATVCAIRDDRP